MPERLVRPRSIAAALARASARLAQAGIADPRREAVGLWAAAMGPEVKPGDVWLGRHEPLARAVAARFWAAVARRARGMPFAYATGSVGFRRLHLKLDRRALIPRPETEGLVDCVLEWARAQGGPGGVVADVGTGSGCIALALATEGSFERVIAVERSSEAAALARENVALLAPSVPVEVREGDLLTPLESERLRAIVSNPPYLSSAEHAALDPAVRLWEPPEALQSGPDGLSATRALLAGGRALLETGGLLALELDERRARDTLALAHEHGWSGAQVSRDAFGRPRFLVAIS